jgi:uncharacterized protein YneF (UPF0154 family)
MDNEIKKFINEPQVNRQKIMTIFENQGKKIGNKKI